MNAHLIRLVDGYDYMWDNDFWTMAIIAFLAFAALFMAAWFSSWPCLVVGLLAVIVPSLVAWYLGENKE